MWKGFDVMETTFFLKAVNGTNITENSFGHKIDPPTAKPNFSGVLKHFRRKFTKTSLYGLKMIQKEANNYSVHFFSTRGNGEKQQEIIDLIQTTFFVKPVKWNKYYKKTIFHLKMSHILLN